MIELHNADCLDAMRLMEDNAFDLAIVDPPYGIGEDGGSNHSRSVLANTTKYISKSWDKTPPSKEYFQEMQRVSKNQIIFGANHFISRINNNDSSCWIVWDKRNGGNDFADCELAWGSFDTTVRKFSYRWHGMLQENMKNKEHRIHPTQKPVALYTWLLEKYAKKGDTILDTHLGSGSIAIAAHNLGYDLTGYELDKDYYVAACKRLENHQKQLRMF